jgi:anti-anti-sigma factor
MTVSQSLISGSADSGSGRAAVADAVFAVSAVVHRPAGQVSATGRLVGDAAATGLSAVLEHELAIGCHFVRLDLSELSMLDRAGFDVLVEAHHQFLAVGGALIMTGVGPRIARLLQLTGLDRTLFTIARTSDVSSAGVGPAEAGGPSAW